MNERAHAVWSHALLLPVAVAAAWLAWPEAPARADEPTPAAGDEPADAAAQADAAPPPHARPAAPAAPATAAAVATAPKPRDRPWSLATGFGLGAMVGAGASATPAGYLLAERRIVGPLSIIGRVAFSILRSTGDTDDPSVLYGSTLSISAGGGVGIRVAFTPPEVLGVSAFGLLEGSYAHSTYGVAKATFESVGGDFGLTLDRDIVPGFGIRASAVLASISYGYSHYDELVGADAGPLPITAHQTNLAFQFSPAVELRWSF